MDGMAPGHAVHYKIRVAGLISPRWSAWFEGLTITQTETGESILCGPVADQAALRGLLDKVSDLNLVLLSVERIELEDQN